MKSRNDTDIFSWMKCHEMLYKRLLIIQKQNLSVVKRRQTLNNDCSACGIKQKSHLWIRVFSKSCTYDSLRYDTIRDAILTCARKPTWVQGKIKRFVFDADMYSLSQLVSHYRADSSYLVRDEWLAPRGSRYAVIIRQNDCNTRVRMYARQLGL